jgi:hypothetical protein
MRRIIEVALGEALGKLSKAAKPRLAQGSEETIDETITLRVRGTVKKGEDTEYRPTVDIPLKLALALVLEKAGYGREGQRENAVALLVEAMTEALEAGEKADEAITERIRDIDAAMERVQAGLNKLPLKTKNGAVRVNVQVEELQPVNLVGQPM